MHLLPYLLAFALSADPASSVEEPQQPKIDEAIVVTATRSERAVSELPVSTTVVKEEDIESAPARSVDDLLRTVPGVHMAIVSGSGSTPNNQKISMHGLGGTRALVLLDGVPLHDPYSGIVQWQRVSLDSLRQVEVVRGGNTSLFGNFALGGTINLITKPVDSNAITADVSYGTNATERQILTVDHAVNDALALRVSHNRNTSDGYMRVPNPGPIDTRGWGDSWMTAGRADYKLSDTAAAFAKASIAQINISQGTPGTYTDRDVLDTSAGAHRATGTNGFLNATAFYQRQKERLVNSTIIGQRESEFVSQDASIPSTVVGGSLEWSLQRRGVLPFLSIGVDARRTKAEESRVTFNRSGAVTQRNLVTGQQTSIGVFAQASWRPSDRIEVLTSARLDIFRNENGSDVVVGGKATEYPAASSTQLDPRVSVRYALDRHSAVRGSIYRAFGAPALRDMYRNNQTGNSLVLGNPYLKPETLVGGEVGYEWAGDRGRAEVNVYRSTIDGLVSRAHVNGQPANVFQTVNLGTARAQGLEFVGELRLSRRLSMNAGYTFADSTIIEDPDPDIVGNMIPEVSKHVGSLGLRFHGDRGTTIDMRGRVLSRQYGEAANQAVAPAHRIVDLSASQQLRSWLDVYATLENVFDQGYYFALTPTSFRSGLPRTFTAGLRFSRFAK
ncbi:MAG TPA: TonB-dependent receptor [Thermoanaerobaculia bacterium]|nr:TonB-dependent receptor [Thermoanaerobaculia bacterium]